MRVISTIISLFAAWLLIATPVMACCVTGHTDMATSMSMAQEISAPPCHETEPGPATKTDTDQTPEKFCPSCDDCFVSPTDHGDTQYAVTVGADSEYMALLQTSAPLIAADIRLPDSTAPPRRRTPPVDGPLFTTDRLLI